MFVNYCFRKSSMNNNNNNKIYEIINLLKFVQFVLIIIILQLIQSTNGDLDWMQTCDPCHCQWNSGKKSADCTNKHLISVPHNLSNELQVIHLSQNMITGLRREEFMEANLNNLHKIYMRNSSMQKIHRDALKGLTILIEIDFSYNYIRELNAGTFNGLSKLRNLVMNNNEIEVLPNFLFANLNYLSRVEFKNNHLKSIEINVFGSLPLLSAVYLESNQLTLLHREIFAHTPKLLHLSLAQNPWNCSCELKEFRDFSIKDHLYTSPTACHEPRHLRDKQWNEVPSDSFACQPRVLGTQHKFIKAHMNNVTLSCKIESVPRPNITWLYNKRPINFKDYRYKVMHTYETNHGSSLSVMTSVLSIKDLNPNDIGIYTCIAENRGGRTESEFELLIGNDHNLLDHNDKTVSTSISDDTYSNVWLIICLIIMTLLFLLIVIVLMIFWYCRRIKAYQKNTTIATDSMKTAKSIKPEGSMLAGGSIIREMQKSLLNEVNPVEKPPRRTDHDSITGEDEDVNDMKKTLLDDNSFFYCRSSLDEDANVSNTKLIQQQQQQQQTLRRNFVENSLPPDLLSFPARGTPTSPSIKSSLTNLPEHILYGVRSSPLTSPIFAHMSGQGIYDSMFVKPSLSGFMTLQHPKSRNAGLSLPTTTTAAGAGIGTIERQLHHPKQQQFQQEESPFTPAPVIYTPPPTSALVIKQGYMTLPRKPRVPSWTSVSSRIMSQQQQQQQSQHQQQQQQQQQQNNNNKFHSPNSSENSSTANLEFLMEPVYDNLGVRTTAGGNSTLNLNKTNPISDTVVRYSMRHRPLPATPSLNSGNNNLSMEIENEHTNLSNNNNHDAMPISNVPLYASNNQQCSSTTKVYEPIEDIYSRQLQQQQKSFLNDYRYTSNENNSSSILSNKGEVLIKSTKTPPQPPPKPKKKLSLTTSIKGQRNTSQIFDDEGDDGTEV